MDARSGRLRRARHACRDPRRRPATNAAALLAILEGERSPRADLVLLNAALALVVASEAVDIDDGMARARTAVETGRARAALDALRRERESDPTTELRGDSMIDMLEKLYAAKAVVRAADEAREPLDVLRERAQKPARRTPSLPHRVDVGAGSAIVAEIKRASPSVGLIVPHLDPAEIARTYEASGADAIAC